MILSHQSLEIWGEEFVTPFSSSLVGPASIDIRLGNKVRLPKTFNGIVRKKTDPKLLWCDEVEFYEWVLLPGELALFHSLEVVDIPDYCSVDLVCKSTVGRIGLEHLHSGYGDPGFNGQWTFELFNASMWPIALEAGETYLQMVVSLLDRPTDLSYKVTGRYNGQMGATAHRVK